MSKLDPSVFGVSIIKDCLGQLEGELQAQSSIRYLPSNSSEVTLMCHIFGWR